MIRAGNYKQELKSNKSIKQFLVKENESQCEKRFNTDELLIVPKPLGM